MPDPTLRWEIYSDGNGAWAYSGRIAVALVNLRREDGRRIGWRVKLEAINPPSRISRLHGGVGVAQSLRHGQRIVERIWRRWLVEAELADG